MKWFGFVSGGIVGIGLTSLAWFANQRGDKPVAAKAALVAAKDDDEAARASTARATIELARAALRTAMAETQQPTPTSDPQQQQQQQHDLPQSPEPVDPAARAMAERDRHVNRLESSGPSPNDFLSLGRNVENEWSAVVASSKTGVTLSPVRCYRAGCYLTLAHTKRETLDNLTSRFTESKSFHEWPGGKYRSGPIATGSRGTEVTWVFFGPENELTETGN